jgi:SAM-dependent methyltransferase
VTDRTESASVPGAVSSSRWHLAQEAERDYWRWKTDVIRDPQYRMQLATRAERIWSLITDRIARVERVVEIGGGGTQLIDFVSAPQRIGLDPLMGFYRQQFRGVMDEDVSAIVAVGEGLPLRSDSIDVVIQRNVLDHVADPFGVCRETYRVLKPGGIAYIALNTFSGPLYWFRRVKKQQEHPFAFSTAEAGRLVRRSGLRIVSEIRDAGETLEEVHEIESPSMYRRVAKRALISLNSYHFLELIATKA